MKWDKYMKRITAIITAVLTMILSLSVTAQTEISEGQWTISTDGVVTGTDVIESEGEMYVDFMSFIKVLTTNVSRDDKRDDIFFTYAGEEYICQIRTVFPDVTEPRFCIGSAKWLSESDNPYNARLIALVIGEGEHVGAKYRIVDRNIYVESEACGRIMDIFGCSFDMDKDEMVIHISFNKDNPGELYINDENINIDERFYMLSPLEARSIVGAPSMFVPFRAVMEALGSKVRWDELNGDIYFDFAGERYVCICVNDPSGSKLTICKPEDREPFPYMNDNYLEAFCPYENIDGKVYVTELGMKELLTELGCRVESSAGNRTFKIWTEKKAESGQ